MHRLLLLLLLATPLAAQLAHAADIAGRLFFTPDERLALDRARAQNIAVANQQNRSQNGLLKLDGVVQRSDGKQIFWVNGRPVVNGADVADPRLSKASPDSMQSLQMPLSNQRFRMKVGQSINPVTGVAREGYELPRDSASVNDSTPASGTQAGSTRP